MVTHAMKGVAAFTAGLAHEASGRWRSRCPCCARPMRSMRGHRHDVATPTDARSMAHNVAVANGGNVGVWVYTCHRCNSEQGRRNFRQWAANLSAYRDPRAALVMALADFVDRWLELNGVDAYERGRGPREEDKAA